METNPLLVEQLVGKHDMQRHIIRSHSRANMASEVVRGFHAVLVKQAKAKKGARGEKPIALAAILKYLLDNNVYGLSLSELLSGNHLLGIREMFLSLGKAHLESPESSWNMIAGTPGELETQVSQYKKGGNDVDAAFASLRQHDVESLLSEFERLREIVWIAKHRSEIDDWFRTESGVFAAELPRSEDEEDEGLIWYESFAANYVIGHADKFRGDRPQHIWFELNLGDTRIDKKVSGRDHADLLLQFPDEVWIVEVKFSANSPDPETALVKRCKRQLEKYGKELEHLLEKGWFPGRIVRLAVFWAYWYRRTNDSEIDRRYGRWPVERKA